MQQLAMALSMTAIHVDHRQVVDRTELRGVYEFNLAYDEFPQVQFGRHDLPDMSAAVQQQSGLRLEERKDPIETLVIVRLEKPTEN